MKSITISDLKHETSKLLERVALGKSFKIRRGNEAIAVIKPLKKKEGCPRPNFRSRLQETYGGVTLEQTATELLNDERGDR